MVMPSLPDDGFKVPDDNPNGQETYGPWTLRWSGWQHGVTTSGYALKWDAWWVAWRTDSPVENATGEAEAIISMVNGPTCPVRSGATIPESDGLSTLFSSSRIAERANAFKAEARARLLDRLDSMSITAEVARLA
jgi:hypothetical protein